MKSFSWRLIQISAVGLLAVSAWLWTPNTSWQEMHDQYAYPDSKFVNLQNGVRMHYRDFGNPRGYPIVLIHGTSDSLLTWAKMSESLEQDFRLLAMDLPGHGLSSEHPQHDYSAEAFSQSIQLLMTHAGLSSATLIGNSLGGRIAWRTALAQPAKVDALVLLDPSGVPQQNHGKSNLGFRLLRTKMGRFLGRVFTPRILIEKSLFDTVADPNIVDKGLIDRYWLLLRLPGNRQALTQMILQQRNQQAWQKIGEIIQPTLIIWGAEDTITPTAQAAVFDQAMTNSRLVVYPNVGHLPMVEVPIKTASNIRSFIENNRTTLIQ